MDHKMRGYEWKSSLILLLLCHSIIPSQSFFFRPFFRRQSPTLASSNRDHVVSGAEASEQQPTSLAIPPRASQQSPRLLYATLGSQDFHVPKSLCIACEKFPWQPVAGADAPTLGLQSQQQIQSSIPEQPSLTLVVNKLGGGNRRPFAIQFDPSQTQNNVGSAATQVLSSVNQEPAPPEPSAPSAPSAPPSQEYGPPSSDTRQPTVLQPVRSGPVWHPTSRPAQFYQTPALPSQLPSEGIPSTLQPTPGQTVSFSFNNAPPQPFPPQRPAQQRPSLLQPVRNVGPYRESIQPPSPRPVDQSPPQPPVAPPSQFNFRVVRPGGWGDSMVFSKNRPPIPPLNVGSLVAAAQQQDKHKHGFQIQGVQPAQLIYQEHIKVNDNLSGPGPSGNQYGVPKPQAHTGPSQQQSQPENPPPSPPQPQQAPQNIKVPILPGPIGSLIINQLPLNNFPSRFTFPKLGANRQQYGPPRLLNQQYGPPFQNRPIPNGQYGLPNNFGPPPQNRPPLPPASYGPPPSQTTNFGPPPAPPTSFGPPPQNQPPPPLTSYGPPAPQNQPPPPPQSQPPSNNYGPPPPAQPPSNNYGPPPQSQSPSNNFGPPPQNQPPPKNYGPPPQNQQQNNNFGPPPQNQPPTNNFGPPPQNQPSNNFGQPPQNQPSGPPANYGPPPQGLPSAPPANYGPPPQSPPLLSIQMRPPKNFGLTQYGIPQNRPPLPPQYAFQPQQGLSLHFRPPAPRDQYLPPPQPAPTEPFIGPQPAPTQPTPESETPSVQEEQPSSPISDQPAPTPPQNYGPPPIFGSQIRHTLPLNLPSPSLPERPFPPVVSYGPPKNGNNQGPTFFIIPQNQNFMPNPSQSLALEMQPPQMYAPNFGLPLNFGPNFGLQPPAQGFSQQPNFGLQSPSNFLQQATFVPQPTAPSVGQQLGNTYGQPSFTSPQATGPSSDEGTDSQPPPSGPSGQAGQTYYASPSAPSESEIPSDKLLPDQVAATNVQVEPQEEQQQSTPVSIPYIVQLHQENRGSGNSGFSSFQLKGNGNANIVPIPVPKFIGSESQREVIQANLDFVPSPQKTAFSSPIPSRDGEFVRNPNLQSAGDSENGFEGDRNAPHLEGGKAVGIQGGWEIIPATQYDITHLFKNGPEPNTQTRPDPLPVPVPIPVPASPPPTSPLFIVSSQTRKPEPTLLPDTSNQVDQVSQDVSSDVRENGLSQQSIISTSMLQNFPPRPFSVGIPIVQATQVQQPNTQFDPLPPSIVSALHHAQRTSFLTHSHLVPSPEGLKETVYINSVSVPEQNQTEVENYSQTVAPETASVDEGKDSNRIENVRAIELGPGGVPVGCSNEQHWMDGQKSQVLVPSGKTPYFLYYPTPVQQSSVYWVEQPTPQFSPSITQPISTLAPNNQLYDPKATAGSQTVFSPPIFGWSPKVVPTSNALITDERDEKAQKQYEQELQPRPTTTTPFDIISVGKESLEEDNVQSIETVEVPATTTHSPVTTTQPLFNRPTQFRPSLPVIAPAPSQSFRHSDYETSTPKTFHSTGTEYVKIKSSGRPKSPKLVDDVLSPEKTYTEISGPTTTADCITDPTETPLVATSANAIDGTTTGQPTSPTTTRSRNGSPERIRLRVGARFPAGRPSISSTYFPTSSTPEPELITGSVSPASATVVPVYRPSTIEPFIASQSLRTTVGPPSTNSHLPLNHLLTLEDIYKNSETKQVEENRETIGTSTQQSTSFSVSVDTHPSSSAVPSPAFGDKERTSPRKLYSPDEVAALGSDLQAQSISAGSTTRSQQDSFGSKTSRFTTTPQPDLVRLNASTSTSSPTMVTSTKVVKTVRVRQRMRPGGSGFTGPIRSRFTHGGRVRVVQRPVTQEYIKNFPEFAAPEGESLGKEEEEEVKNALIDLKKIR